VLLWSVVARQIASALAYSLIEYKNKQIIFLWNKKSRYSPLQAAPRVLAPLLHRPARSGGHRPTRIEE
ncbi:TPA: hypothetical protein ACKRQZ_006124, partial [Pseudomonas aeruginosa]